MTPTLATAIFTLLPISSDAGDCDPKTALAYDGVDDRVTVPFHPSFPKETFTLTAWVRLADVEETASILAHGEDEVSDNLPWGLYVLADGQFTLLIEDSTDLNSQHDSGIAVDDGTWHHVAATRELSGAVALYLDGVPVLLDPSSLTPSPHCNQDVSIGASRGANGGPPAGGQPPCHWLDGELDEVSMWSAALPAGEVLAIYRNGIADPSDARLQGYWKLDEAGSQVVGDLSSAGNHGFLGDDPNVPDASDPLHVLSTAPTCCLERELCLNTEPGTITTGDLFETVTWGGEPDRPAILVVVDVSGIPIFRVLARDRFDGDGEDRFSAVIPPGLPAPLEVTFQSFGFTPSGRLRDTNRELVEIR